jgi:hypothetical protein
MRRGVRNLMAFDPTLSLLVEAAERGDRSAADVLFSRLYAELHRIARRELARQGLPISLSASTATSGLH